MNTQRRRSLRPHSPCLRATIAVSSPLWLLLPAFVQVAAAQAPPASATAAPPAATPSGPPPAQPEALPPTPLVEPAPGATPAPVGTGGASAAATAPPATAGTPATHDEYDGPPLLLAPASRKPKLGGYGGVTVAYSRMLHRDGVLVGGEGALLMEHKLSLGMAGYGFSRTPSGPSAADGTSREYFSGYGGFTIRYAVYSDIPLYASFGVLVGGGAITLAPEHDTEDADEHEVEVRGFFVLQPDASLHVNMTRWLRFSLTAGYRMATAVDTFEYQADDVGGVVVGGNIQAGWF